MIPLPDPGLPKGYDGKGIERPSNVAATDETFKKAPNAKAKGRQQTGLDL